MNPILLLAIVLGLIANVTSFAGRASYYDDGPGLYAAVHSFRFGNPRYKLTVCRADDPRRCVTVVVRDHCQCLVGTASERIIDLSPSAFERLAPLSVGLVKVTIGGRAPATNPTAKPVPTAPPTDVGP